MIRNRFSSRSRKPLQENEENDVSYNHPKAKQWIVAMAKCDYQELHKILLESPELVKLKDPFTGYNGLHWAAKHGKEDVVKLMAGTYKMDVNAQTNGGYTPLHLAIQFDRDNIFDLLWNTYKANRDLMDFSGKKPMDYRKQKTCVSDSTSSSEYFIEQYLNNVFGSKLPWGGGGTLSGTKSLGKKQRRTQSMLTSSTRSLRKREPRSMINFDLFAPNTSSGETSPARQATEMNNNSRKNSNESEGDLDKIEKDLKDEKNANESNEGKEAKGVGRRESFLRRTFRAAAPIRKSTNKNVAQDTLEE